MRISITCSNCNHDFSAPDNLAGKRAKCPKCGTGVRVVENGLTDSGETSTRSGTRRRRGGSPKGLIVVGVIAALVAGAAGLSHLQGLLQSPPAANQQLPVASNPAPAPATSNSQPGIRPAANQGASTSESIEAAPAEQIADANAWEDLPALADEPENLKPGFAEASQSRNRALTREEAVDEYDTERGKMLLVKMKKMAIVRVVAYENSEDSGNPGNSGDSGEPRYQTTPEGFRGALNPRPAGSPNAGGIRESRPPRPTGSAKKRSNGYGANRGKSDDDDQDSGDPIWKRLIERSKTTLKVTGIVPTTDSPDRKSAVLSVMLTAMPKEDDDGDLMDWTVSAELICADLSNPSQPEYAKVWKADQELGTLSQKAFDDGKLSKAVNDGLTEFCTSLRAARVRAERAMKEAHEADSDSNEADD